MMKRHTPIACLSLFLSAGVAHAIVLVPGDAVITSGTATTPGTVIASVTDPVVGVNALSETRYTGELTAEVVMEAGGTLDFWYQFTNSPNSMDAVERLSMTDFGGFATDVDWLNDGSGTQASTFADRSNDGDKVSFNFSPNPLGSGTIQPGATSRWLVIKTDATHFTEGTTSVIDGAIDSVITFAPAAVPEPASLALVSFGALALRRRFRSRCRS